MKLPIAGEFYKPDFFHSDTPTREVLIKSKQRIT